MGLGVGAVIAYAAGVWFGYSTLVVLAVGALVLLAGGVLTVAVRPAVTLSREVAPDRVTVGESALGRLDVHNTSRWRAPAFAAVDAVGNDTIPLRVSGLAGRGRRTIRYPVPARRRGRLRLGPLTIQRRDPFGLLAWRQRQAADAVLWVHPRVHQMRALPVGIVPNYEGRTTQNAKRGTVTFASLREYVPGDDPRQIHWRSTARTGTLIVREHVDTTEPTTTVVLQTDPGSFSAEGFEDAVEFAASVVRAVEGTGRPAALTIVGEDDTVAAGARDPLDRLSLVHLGTSRDPVRLLEAMNRVPAGGALVVVAGTVEPAVLGRLAEQRRRFSPIVVAAFDPHAPRATTRRRPGMCVLVARSAPEAVAAWHGMIDGKLG
jgi:uncharacterized protein (DUF58 family)